MASQLNWYRVWESNPPTGRFETLDRFQDGGTIRYAYPAVEYWCKQKATPVLIREQVSIRLLLLYQETLALTYYS